MSFRVKVYLAALALCILFWVFVIGFITYNVWFK